MTKTTTNYRYVGKPDGPEIFIPEMGIKVGTFTERRADLEASSVYAGMPCIMHHIPQQFRGPYYPNQIPNYDPEFEYPLTFDGWMRCSGKLKHREQGDNSRAGQPCQRKAVHRSGLCQAHGGKLHPLDMPVKSMRDPATMSRAELLKFGYIDVDDLDDEELVRGQARNKDGGFSRGVANKVAQIPKPIYDKMVSRLMDRAHQELRANLLLAIETMGIIANPENDAYEASDKINAAKFIVERVMGKATEKIDLNLGVQKPFEQILTGISPVTREESRARRALEASQPIEAEVIEGEWTALLDQDIAEADVYWSNEESTKTPVVDVPVTGATTTFTTVASTDASRLDQDGNAAVSSPAASTAEELKAKIQAARNRRYAARAQGNTSTRNLAYMRNEIIKMGEPRRIQWTHPDEAKVPTSVKAKETRKRNYERKLQ